MVFLHRIDSKNIADFILPEAIARSIKHAAR